MTAGIYLHSVVPIFALNNFSPLTNEASLPLFSDIYTRIPYNPLTHPFLLFPFLPSSYNFNFVKNLLSPKMEAQLDELDIQWVSSLGPPEIDPSRFYFPSNPLNDRSFLHMKKALTISLESLFKISFKVAPCQARKFTLGSK